MTRIPDLSGGLCAQTDPELFYPEKGGSIREARKICFACQIRSACLEWALTTKDQNGVWGGMSWNEREKLLAERALPKAS